ncbi:protein draper-like isoform X2 [Argopecten irradians]
MGCIQPAHDRPDIDSTAEKDDVFECCTGYKWVETEKRCKVCSDWTYGDECKQRCSCIYDNTRACGHITGVCLCHPHWTGTTCNLLVDVHRKQRSVETDNDTSVPKNLSACPSWFYGINCTETCSCNQNTSTNCNSTSGECVCQPGYTGSRCNQTCENNTFGESCSQRCQCDPITSVACDHVTGNCGCVSGWTGAFCNETCSAGTYGDQCKTNCTCPINANPVCHHVNGTCFCNTDYVLVGDSCQKIETETTSTVSLLSTFLAVFDNPVYVCIITIGGTLLIVAIVMCILWKICRCSCTEVKNRKQQLKYPKQLNNVPTSSSNPPTKIATEPAKTDAIAALAHITSKSIKQEKEVDNPTSAVYGASLEPTGKPPETAGGNYNYRDPLPQSFTSTTPLLPLTLSTIDSSMDGSPYYKNMKASSVSTFKLNEDSQTVNTQYYTNMGIPNQDRNLVSSQPNLSQKPRTKDVTFDDVIADIAKKKGRNNGKTNLKKMNSRSLPNINSVNVEPASIRPTFHLYKNYRSNPDMAPDSAASIYNDTAVSNSTESRNTNVPAKPYTGAKKAARIVPIPVIAPRPPPRSQNESTSPGSNTVPGQPSPPPISKIPTYSNINRNGMGNENASSASHFNMQNVPMIPPAASLPTLGSVGVRTNLSNSGRGEEEEERYEDIAVKSGPETNGIYDDIEQGISRQDRFASGVYAELN